MKRKFVNGMIALFSLLTICVLPVMHAAGAENGDVIYEETVTQARRQADAVFTEYEVLHDNGYTVNMYHAYQGPLCDAAFLRAQGNNMLVTDYFNISIDNNLGIYEIASDVRLRVKIPTDLVKKKRTWWMICVSRNGISYLFKDEDNRDETITFTANRFYAYAMCYTDEEQEAVEEEEEVKVVEAVDENPRSRMHSILDSQTISGTAEVNLSELNAGNTEPVVFYGTKTNRMARLRSNMEDALRLQKEKESVPIFCFTL